MTGQRLLIAADIGTSGARALVFDSGANALSVSREPYSLFTPQSGWSEQDADTIAGAVVEVLRAAVAALPAGASLAGVVFSAQMYSILAADRAGRPLSKSLTWADTRSAEQASAIRRSTSPGLPARTGCPVQAIYPLAKIAWLKANLSLPPEVMFVSIKDYVLFRLTGQFIADWSTASASGLLDIGRHRWDGEALAVAQIATDNLPELVSPRQVMTNWRAEVLQYTGIPAGTPLIAGAGDAPLANIGAGATASGTLAVNIGTSAAARVLAASPVTDPAGRLWTYAADVERWVIGGIIGSGGAVYEWLLKKLLLTDRDVPADDLFRQAERLAQGAPPGADGLLFLPYLSGEQSPGWNPAATGLIHGLTFRHDAGHVIRAAVEGITFALRRAAQPIADTVNTATETIYLTGGLTAFPIWPRTIAAVFGAPVIVPRGSESSARGAAVLGWMALGAADQYEVFAQAGDRIEPDLELVNVYQNRFQAFCALNDSLQHVLDQEKPV